MVDQEKLNRLFWHSRRGMLELDLILVPFVQNIYATLDEQHQALYDRLIECEDQDLFDWFMEKKVALDPDFKYMVAYILDITRDPTRTKV